MRQHITSRRRVRTLLFSASAGLALVLGLTAPVAAQAVAIPAGHPSSSNAPSTRPAATPGNVVNACGPVSAGRARCFAEVRTDVHAGKGVRGPAAHAAGSAATALPPGFGPADLRSAYALPSSGGAGQTVAVVEAGDTPTAEADLAVYRQTYGLPPCTTANGCFRKANQSGAASPLPPDRGWDVETALDLDMVSAACPNCHLLLLEGDDQTFADLAASVDTAVSLGATEVSNSYGATEQNGMQAYAPHYSHPGVAILASSGDIGYGIPNLPAVFTSVIAVGGTSLSKASNTRGWSESAWLGAGSGCSAWIDKPAWQSDPNCPGRMTADVAADADPQTGPAVYDTDNAQAGWLIVGGTSASSPFIAGVIGLAGNPGAFPTAAYLYAHKSGLFDVTHGNNGIFEDCGGDYQCNAVPGYDGPTGNGTPNGISAF
jgi:hypothetical protein